MICEYKSSKARNSELCGHETAHSLSRSMLKECYFSLLFMSGVCFVLLIFLWHLLFISNVDVIQSSDLC